MPLESQIGSTSSSQAFFLHHPLGFGHSKTYCWLLSLLQHKTTIWWGLCGFFTISGLPNMPETEHTVIMAPEHEVLWNHKCFPRIRMCLTYFQQWSRGIQPYMPHWKKAKRWLWMLSGNTGGPTRELQETCTRVQYESGEFLWRATILSSRSHTFNHWAATTQYRKTV